MIEMRATKAARVSDYVPCVSFRDSLTGEMWSLVGRRAIGVNVEVMEVKSIDLPFHYVLTLDGVWLGDEDFAVEQMRDIYLSLLREHDFFLEI